jgi:hypothetical protein
MPLHDLSYQHWNGVHNGVWRRRWTITSNGLRACLQNRWIRQSIMLCWVLALALALGLFLIGQMLVPNSAVIQWIGGFNTYAQTLGRFFMAWLADHPEISIGATENVLFFWFCLYLTLGSIFTLGLAIPLIISRDLASNAMIIYASKAVDRRDYLLGKFSTVFGLMALTWLGPVCGAWLLGNLLTPSWGFFWHSRWALAHALAYGLAISVFLSLLALGVSALSAKGKSSSALWLVWWVFGGVVVPIAAQPQPWLRHASFNYNLDQLAIAIFKLRNDLELITANIPNLDELPPRLRLDSLAAFGQPNLGGALIGLGIMAVLAAAIVTWRSKPE